MNVESELKKAENNDEDEQIVTRMFEQRLKDSLKGVSEQISINYEDQVRLGASGWKERYYFDKFGLKANEITTFMYYFFNCRQELTRYYLEGLSWVYQYYYQGCPSWSWYFPYHYAPFCSDLNLISKGAESIT